MCGLQSFALYSPWNGGILLSGGNHVKLLLGNILISLTSLFIRGLMGRQYNSPPIKEAICEFRFRSETPWDLAVPGLIYAELKDDFPRRLANVITFPNVVKGMWAPEVQAQLDEQMRQDISLSKGLRFWREHAEDGVIVVAP